MSTVPLFKFGDESEGGPYHVDLTSESERATIAEWIAADPDHRDRVNDQFFIGPEPGAQCLTLTNPQGKVFFFRLTRVLRIDIQFPPASTEEEQSRLRRGLTSGFRWLRQRAAAAGFREIVFQSESRMLKVFCRRFGFKESPQELSCLISVDAVTGKITATTATQF